MSGEKPSGMEMMMNSLLRAAGFDPAIIRQHIEEFVGGMEGAKQHLIHRLDTIDARLERIETALAIDRQKSESNGKPFQLEGPQQ